VTFFAVEAEAYNRFVGRYGEALGRALAERAGIERGMSALDVGAGTGKLTGVLAELLGEENEELPFEDDSFDAAFAQLVINFLSDPERGVAEMLRVTREGGVIAAAVWDYGQEMTMLTTFWESAAALDERGVEARDERSRMRFRQEGGLAELWREAGVREARGGAIVVSASYESFDDLWEPFTAGVGPPGAYASSLEPSAQGALREEYFRRLGSPDGPFELTARAWYAVGKK
jgi:SAM-dependent methyltransferase